MVFFLAKPGYVRQVRQLINNQKSVTDLQFGKAIQQIHLSCRRKLSETTNAVNKSSALQLAHK